MRLLVLASGLLLLPTSAQAETFSTPGIGDMAEPLWALGIAFGLAVFAAFKIWRAIKDRQRQ